MRKRFAPNKYVILPKEAPFGGYSREPLAWRSV